ncbi:putative Zn(II)2Cys6 transcription factor [Aspergillus campestris IBT 28561]|uniref:Zn(II)2Cys6 transcription factor n=1 Tax=Aspergillus campestris (strain IBT 28561) TaxID=1392248 RepID=A0A2I1DCN3_ASPC2|nr:putative Zn(II)2Cys6 transcription factor [Aspergillus campestris IBT 28561]PKY07637.1 putative Zn(II)2Cys6 transcription factor [Aspergillus campestris IBT 28561]
MSAPRRNGLLSSCEPCRKSKLRCDHTLPVCQRCVTSRRTQQCTYHPCPLTKGRPKRTLVRSNQNQRESYPDDDDVSPNREPFDWVDKSPSVPARRFEPKPTGNRDESFSPLGFLGPTSHATVFGDDASDGGSQLSLLADINTEAVDSTMVEIGAQILSLLDHLPFYAELLEKRFNLFEGWIFGPQLIREALLGLRMLYHGVVQDSSANNRHARLLEGSRLVFRNTVATIETDPAMTLSEYVAQTTPRWETIGLIFALVGTATYRISPGEAVLTRDGIPGKDRHGLRKIAVAVSDMCLQFCNKVGVISDPLCWAAVQHTVFIIDMHGSNDYRTWQRQGEVVSLVFALGLHQRTVDERTPFFLSEIRSRTMVAAYSMDKELATFLGRPPRICRQYCDLRFPLDISWDDLVAEASIREAAIQQLNPDGWNVQGDPDKGARPRLTLLASILREMILELSLSRDVDNLWDRTVARKTGQIPDPLIDTSQDILAGLLDLVSKQSRAGPVSHLTIFDFSYIGLPAAAVLSKELLRRSQSSANQATSGTSFPRSKIIQNLSVFAAQIETFFPSREGDYDTCMKGLAYIRRVLDSVLSACAGAVSGQPSDETRAVDGGLSGDTDIDFETLFENFDWEQEIRPLFT